MKANTGNTKCQKGLLSIINDERNEKEISLKLAVFYCCTNISYVKKGKIRLEGAKKAALLPGKRPGTQCTGRWVGPTAGMDGCGKPRLHQDFFLFSLLLCTVSVLCSDCPGFCLLSLQNNTHNTNIHAPRGIQTLKPANPETIGRRPSPYTVRLLGPADSIPKPFSP
jgi:hypothetical protein